MSAIDGAIEGASWSRRASLSSSSANRGGRSGVAGRRTKASSGADFLADRATMPGLASAGACVTGAADA